MNNKTTMFYGALPATFEKAKVLRSNLTEHERLLWNELKSNKISGLRFKAQHPMDVFIADFYCHKLKLVIEIDGLSHQDSEQKKYDAGREYDMDKLGITTIRFTNDQVENNLEKVVEHIKEKCDKLLKNSSQKFTPALKGVLDLNLECDQSPLQGVENKDKRKI